MATMFTHSFTRWMLLSVLLAIAVVTSTWTANAQSTSELVFFHHSAQPCKFNLDQFDSVASPSLIESVVEAIPGQPISSGGTCTPDTGEVLTVTLINPLDAVTLTIVGVITTRLDYLDAAGELIGHFNTADGYTPLVSGASVKTLVLQDAQSSPPGSGQLVYFHHSAQPCKFNLEQFDANGYIESIAEAIPSQPISSGGTCTPDAGETLTVTLTNPLDAATLSLIGVITTRLDYFDVNGQYIGYYNTIDGYTAIASNASVKTLVLQDAQAPQPPINTGCYIDAPESVDEDASFIATVRCDSVDGLYGFQYGTTLAGDGATTATSYTLGDFSTNAANTILDLSNTLPSFIQSYTGNDVANGSHSLGSYEVTASKYLTADGSIAVSLDGFLASDMSGAALSALAAAPDASITVNNIMLTLLSGTINVESDGATTLLSSAALSVDGVNYTAADGATVTMVVDQETTALDINISADMNSHLVCSNTVTIADGINDTAIAIGPVTLLAGDVVSVSGDEAINLHDAVAIGSVFGGTATDQEDINGDGTINVLDLVHVGRNYNATSASCTP